MKVLFDEKKLSKLMESANISLILANTRHNIRYLTGGYYYHFHVHSTRMAKTQYLPFVGIPKDKFGDAFYVGRAEERGQIESEGLNVPRLVETVRGTLTAAESVIKTVKSMGLEESTIGVELPFIPADAFLALQKGLPKAKFIDATFVLDELRAIKNKEEIRILQRVYGNVAEAIQAAFVASHPGESTADIARRTELEITNRGASFLFALISAGPGFLRAPSASSRWEKGRILHIDAGGEDNDYIADICRMGCIGEPSRLAKELYSACIEVQNQVRNMVRPGLPCSELLMTGERASKQFPFSSYSRFVAHGIGMVPYEQPTISHENARPLEEGMILSVETDFIHPKEGHVKIEDAVVVTAKGCDGLGDFGREWQIIEP